MTLALKIIWYVACLKQRCKFFSNALLAFQLANDYFCVCVCVCVCVCGVWVCFDAR